MSEKAPFSEFGAFIDKAWLGRRTEAALDPGRPIIDPHHHIWLPPRPDYPIGELEQDLAAGHNVRATVYLESVAFWREDGPEHLKPVGETAQVTAFAEQAAGHGKPNIAAGIIAFVDLMLGDAVQDVFEAHIAAGRGRFRGTRANLYFDPNFNIPVKKPPIDFWDSPDFRAGIKRIAPLGLVCDVMAYFHNLPLIEEMIRTNPETKFVLNHCGGPMGHPAYQDKQKEMFADWSRNIKALAQYPNLYMKLGGLGGPFYGPLIPLHLRGREDPPSSEYLAEAMRPYIDACINAYGPSRCMFESNFPADKYDCDYVVLWNAFKRLAVGYSKSEKDELFAGTAARFYRLSI